MKKILLVLIVIISFVVGYFLSDFLNSRKKGGLSLSLSFLGIQEFENKSYVKSLQYFFTALYFNPRNRLAHRGLALIFYREGSYELAMEEFKNFLESPKDPFYENIEGNRGYVDTALAYCYIADIYDKYKNKEMAIINYQKAVNEYPDLPKYLSAYIKVISEKKQKTDEDIKQMELFSTIYKSVKNIRKES